MLNGLMTFRKKGDETIRKKVKKSDFFRIFRDFFGSVGQLLDNFACFLDNDG